MLLISDLHFTDKPQDEYRFEILDWVAAYFRRTDDKNLLILGDLTDSKDHHSSKLVNEIVRRLLMLADIGMEVFILKGNHDYIDPAKPFFGFLSNFEYLNFIVEPRCMLIEGQHCLFLPHSRSPTIEWSEDPVFQKWKNKADFTFMHESVIGSVTSNGYEMEAGLPPSYFNSFSGEVISGDIHCPQTIGRVSYVGTPYSIRFNDHYRGRALSIRDGKVTELFPDIKNRVTFDVSSVKEFMDSACRLLPGDQIKVRFELSEGNEALWEGIRKKLYECCKALKVELHVLQVVHPRPLPLRGKKHKSTGGLVPCSAANIVDKFSKQRGLGKAKHKAGRRVVDGT